MAPAGASFWRKAGLSYLQYLNIATRTVRSGLKEPLRISAVSREAVSYNKAGADGIKVHVGSSLPKL
eukprot:gene12995-14990_t